MKSFSQTHLLHYLVTLLLTILLQSSEPIAIHLSRDQADFIAQRVWENEANGDLDYLIYWNKNESFLSLGIAHFLWYGKDNRDRYQEMFPLLVDYFAKHNVRLPEWLDRDTPCLWEDYDSFMKAKNEKSPQYQELYDLLVRTMPIQVNFTIERMQDALPKIVAVIHDPQREEQIKKAYYRMLNSKNGVLSTHGVYAVLDYVNFKGEGTSPDERYHGEGWGLLQVLEAMDPMTENASRAFADAAKEVLSRRIRNAPPERNETQWREGWFKRVESYYVTE
jgi:hypothetical protein